MADVIEIRLPLRPGYLQVLRAAAGVIAGTLSFTYDEVMQLRAAVSEAFNVALGQAEAAGEAGEELTVRFRVDLAALEIQLEGPEGLVSSLQRPEREESKVLLESLMDEVDIDHDAAGKQVLRMTKRKSIEAT